MMDGKIHSQHLFDLPPVLLIVDYLFFFFYSFFLLLLTWRNLNPFHFLSSELLSLLEKDSLLSLLSLYMIVVLSSGLSCKAESKDIQSFFSGVVTNESTDSVSSIFQRIKGESLNSFHYEMNVKK